MAAKAWKDLERRACRALGGQRRGPEPGSDCVGSPFSVEVKRCTRYQLRRSWVEQARRQAKVDAKPWVIVVGEHGDRAPLAVTSLATFVRLTQKAGLVEEAA